ncbi:MAG TPA: Hsp20/alpha crystallin family protein [Pseudomonadales bacterium]|nr:Hsp20/alpha crystallin family protein [Pseudomonadales bacterium]
MSTVRWNPIAEMDELFRRSLGPQWNRPAAGEAMAEADFVPAVDIRESADAYEIEVELPAVDPAAVKVDLRESILTVRGERNRPELPEGVKEHRAERRYGRFARAFVLPDDADPDSIRARSRNGVLQISVAKRAEVQPRSIEIEVH